ncbi:MAG: RHS repeat-associated core domain-containing protein, partial [Actinobacteria bacterium]|nr:RHS repeat-associated core domain-containing protein [Actinomycetota bacterium]
SLGSGSPDSSPQASANYAYDPTGLISSETTTTTGPQGPSCSPSAPLKTSKPPAPVPCATTTGFTWNTASSIPTAIEVGSYYYVYGPQGTPIEQIGPNGSTLSYLANREGSTVALVDSAGHVVARYAYSAYGSLICGPFTHPNTPPNSPPCHPSPPTPPAACPPPSQHSPVGPPPCIARAIAANHFLYDGQYLDTVSGLYYLRARWYDPATGQFTSIDALVAITGQPYSYAGGDPVNGSDPSGTCTRWNLSCHWDNFKWWLKIEASSSGKVAVNENQAENFLISNGIPCDAANDWIESFNWDQPVYMTLTTNISGSVYRYYGGKSIARGYFYTNFSGYYFPQWYIQSELALNPFQNSAYWVTQVGASNSFTGTPLVLEGAINGGGANIEQYVVYNPNEWAFGQGVPTGWSTFWNPPPPPPWWKTIPYSPIDPD